MRGNYSSGGSSSSEGAKRELIQSIQQRKIFCNEINQ